MHQGTFFLPLPRTHCDFLPQNVFPSFNSATALSNINPIWGYEWPRAPLPRVVSHVITIIYKTHSGSVASVASPGPRPCTLQSIFARNSELLRVSMVVRASITWNIQDAWRLPWGPAQGFYSDLIIRHDFFMSYDSPVELESALNPCDSHGNQKGGGAGCPLLPLSLTLRPNKGRKKAEGSFIKHTGCTIMWERACYWIT